MNEVPPLSQFRRSVSAVDANVDMHGEPHDGQRDFLTDDNARTSTDMDAPIRTLMPAGLRSLKIPGVAALSGAVAAVVVVGIAAGLTGFTGREDPRLAQLTVRNADLTRDVQALTDKLRTLETGFVVSGETSDRIGARQQADGAQLTTIKASLDQLIAQNQRNRDELAGVSVPALFGVAVVQLRNAITAGKPFAWELVNVRGIAGSTPALLAQINRLAPLATEGVPGDDELAISVGALNFNDALTGRSSLIATGMDAFTRVFGNASATSAATVNQQLLARASIRLSAGDYAGATSDLAALRGSAAGAARAVVDGARQRATAQDAVDILSNAARDGLQQQVRAALQAP